jgi:hypothetical protein
MILIALAAASAPLLPPALARDMRCVAVIGIARNPAFARDGALYTAIVGAEAMDATGASREAVRDMILAQAKIVRGAKPAATELSTCVAQMKARVAIEKAAP